MVGETLNVSLFVDMADVNKTVVLRPVKVDHNVSVCKFSTLVKRDDSLNMTNVGSDIKLAEVLKRGGDVDKSGENETLGVAENVGDIDALLSKDEIIVASLLCEALVCLSIGDTGVKLVNVDVLSTFDLSEILDSI